MGWRTVEAYRGVDRRRYRVKWRLELMQAVFKRQKHPAAGVQKVRVGVPAEFSRGCLEEQ